MDWHSIFDKMYKSRKMRTPEEVQIFDESLGELSDLHDSELLRQLFYVFDDSTEQQDVMWGLIHLIETYELSDVLQGMVMAMPDTLPHAKDWINILNYRILNDDTALPAYKQTISALPPEKKRIVTNFLKEMSVSEPEFTKRIKGLLGE